MDVSLWPASTPVALAVRKGICHVTSATACQSGSLSRRLFVSFSLLLIQYPLLFSSLHHQRSRQQPKGRRLAVVHESALKGISAQVDERSEVD